MKHWEESEASEHHPGSISLKDQTKTKIAVVLNIFVRDGMIVFEEALEGCFEVAMPPDMAIETLEEAIAWIKGQNL